MEFSGGAQPSSPSTIECRPCRKSYPTAELTNPKRCPQCGGPTLSSVQKDSQKAATVQALAELRRESVRLMRLTSLSMVTVQFLAYALPDRQSADFFNHTVTAAAFVATIATEIWAFTAARVWMILASVFIQIAAILFFAVASVFFSIFLPPRLAALIGCLPLAGSLMAWHQFRGYNNILRLDTRGR